MPDQFANTQNIDTPQEGDVHMEVIEGRVYIFRFENGEWGPGVLADG